MIGAVKCVRNVHARRSVQHAATIRMPMATRVCWIALDAAVARVSIGHLPAVHHLSAVCTDSLEDHQWCKLKQEGEGSCRSFDDPDALGQNTEEYNYGDTRKVATKAGMIRYKHQPNNEAILAFKRTVCTENTNGNRICDVFKTFQCRKCTTSPGKVAVAVFHTLMDNVRAIHNLLAITTKTRGSSVPLHL